MGFKHTDDSNSRTQKIQNRFYVVFEGNFVGEQTQT